MNVKNVKRVRDVIAALPPERLDMRWLFVKDGTPNFSDATFRMDTLLKECGTAACIAGWTNATFKAGKAADATTAEELLGITARQAAKLFTPPGYEVKGRYTHAAAVRVLDLLIATGEVDWVSARRAEGTEAAGSEGEAGAPGGPQ